MGKAEQQFGHLTDAQIEHYGDRTSGEGPNQNGLEVDQAIESHLADCAGCRTRVLEFHRSRFGVMSDPFPSAARQSHPPTAECPSEDALSNLAAGLSSGSESATLTQHAAQCPHCGPILRAYTEDFSDDLSREDQALLSKLKSSTPEWQKKMAQQMAAAVSVPATSATHQSAAAEQAASEQDRVAQSLARDGSVPEVTRVAQPPSAVRVQAKPSLLHMPSLKWILPPVALAATAVIAFFIWNAQRETPQKVEKLLARAYTENRTMEMRWPGAEWAQVRTTRGSEGSRPASLFRAEVIIGQHGAPSSDRDWLRAKAQTEIMEWNPRAAIPLLERALGVAGKSRAIQLDLATAHFELGELSGDRQDYERALEIIVAVLKDDPKNQAALYNRAVLDERLNRLDDAAKDWQVVLNTETDPQWLREAELKYRALVKSR